MPGGGRGWWFAEQTFHDPGPAQDGRRYGAVCRDFENACLGEQAAAHAVGGQVHADKALVFGNIAADAIVPGDAGIEGEEVGLNEVCHREILLQHFSEKGLGLTDHGELEHLVEFRIQG